MSSPTPSEPPGASLLVRVDGNVRDVHLPVHSSVARLHHMYELIGCTTVDVVRLTTRIDMWIDDTGAYTWPPNPLATMLAHRFGRTWQPYHGAALLCSVDDEGNSVDLNHGQLIGVLSHLADIAAS